MTSPVMAKCDAVLDDVGENTQALARRTRELSVMPVNYTRRALESTQLDFSVDELHAVIAEDAYAGRMINTIEGQVP
jgi:hypothetical protein